MLCNNTNPIQFLTSSFLFSFEKVGSRDINRLSGFQESPEPRWAAQRENTFPHLVLIEALETPVKLIPTGWKESHRILVQVLLNSLFMLSSHISPVFPFPPV